MISCEGRLFAACRCSLSRTQRPHTNRAFFPNPFSNQSQKPGKLLFPPPQRTLTGDTVCDAQVKTRTPGNLSMEYSEEHAEAVGRVPFVNWYPGHIAKAERQLKEQLKLVDVVLEVRDARIPIATSHPDVRAWIGQKPHLLVLNREDMISKKDKDAWARFFGSRGEEPLWTVGNKGAGIQKVMRRMQQVSKVVNQKRHKKGLKPRPVRACVIGFPNIGKSALINRFVAKRVVDSAPRPGVTRALRWVRMGGDVDMLDSPGVIPAHFKNQVAAQKLAMCNDIGQASYVDSLIAAQLIENFRSLPHREMAMSKVQDRYALDPREGTGEDFVNAVAAKLFCGDMERAGVRILKDFRTLNFGAIALEHPSMLKRH